MVYQVAFLFMWRGDMTQWTGPKLTLDIFPQFNLCRTGRSTLAWSCQNGLTQIRKPFQWWHCWADSIDGGGASRIKHQKKNVKHKVSPCDLKTEIPQRNFYRSALFIHFRKYVAVIAYFVIYDLRIFSLFRVSQSLNPFVSSGLQQIVFWWMWFLAMQTSQKNQAGRLS